jgi:predicted helicase
MQTTTAQKKAIDHYYKELAAYHEKKVTHETAVRSAFQYLLSAFAQSANWVLIPEQTLANGKRPDGTLRDSFNLPRGYWEAKDTKDDLTSEIRKKINIGYPTTNTIFEDTRKAILYQNNKPVLEADLTRPKELTSVLDSFFHYAEPDIATFEHAVDDFKESIPDLAQGLLERIKEEHIKNKAFVAAFASFLELCRTSLDPHMSSNTVDEMLVQHLLTERLFRTIFNNPDFTRRNVIAAEIEKVIQALTSRAFDRNEFARKLDRFYVAIENAAKNLYDWSEKQHFLNTVYERFFQGFSTKQADTHGIVYTPQEIVEFMCASVDVILKREFGSSLSTPGVQILDPCVGTGNFIVNLIQKNISGGSLVYKYENDLFCNEIMLLPYYIASLNIEHAYYERMGQYRPFEGIAFADTLNLEGQQMELFSERNTERIQREKQAQIMVVIGNPPYNVGQKSENDNNKNRKYSVIDSRIRETYVKESKATLNIQLYDPYVKFFRWATDRLQGRDGIVCYVSNNSFIDQFTFDGVRKHFLKDFTQIYHLDLHGNVRKNPKLSGTTHNVFGIQVGVGITIAIRVSQSSKRALYYYRVPEDWRKTEKLSFLKEKGSVNEIEWQELEPDNRNTWITEGLRPEFATFIPIGTKEGKSAAGTGTGTILKTYSAGVYTSRDSIVYDFDADKLASKIKEFVENYNSEVSRWIRAGRPASIDDFVHYDKVKWSRNLKRDLRIERYLQFGTNNIRKSLYRPYTNKWLYYADIVTDERGTTNMFFPTSMSETENVVIWLKVGTEWPMFALATNNISDYLPQGGSKCFPYYTYLEDGSNRRENIIDWALIQFRDKYGAHVSKWNIFHYVYALLHHPHYRERYAENLKRDLPRIPILTNQEAFATCVRLGKQLMDLHVHYEEARQYPLTWQENKDVPITWHVEKMRLSPDKSTLKVNEWLTLADIPQECYQYRLGNRSALEWVIDQYQVSMEARSGIVSDPNREDDEQYIVHLVGKVVTVSVETVKLVEELAQKVKQDDWLSKEQEEVSRP